MWSPGNLVCDSFLCDLKQAVTIKRQLKRKFMVRDQVLKPTIVFVCETQKNEFLWYANSLYCHQNLISLCEFGFTRNKQNGFETYKCPPSTMMWNGGSEAVRQKATKPDIYIYTHTHSSINDISIVVGTENRVFQETLIEVGLPHACRHEAGTSNTERRAQAANAPSSFTA